MLKHQDIVRISPEEQRLMDRFGELSSGSGSHSPSLVTMRQNLPEISVDIDACYLSNPLATDLFWSHFNSDSLNDPQFITRMFEAYPSQNRDIAEKLASTIEVDPDRIFVANGATEAIQAIVHNYASHLHVSLPTFSPYYEFVQPQQRVTTYQLDSADNFVLDPERYVQSVLGSGADTAVLISPNNPDGYLIPDNHLVWILSRLRSLKTVIVDESFVHFAGRQNTDALPTLLGITRQFENVTIVKSMSKDFGVAGIRAGYAIMNPNRVTELLNRGYLWNINGIAEYFFSLFARPMFQDEYRTVLAEYREHIDRFTSMTSNIGGMCAYPTSANFQLMQMPADVSAEMVTNLMLIRHGVYVRSCDDKVGLDGEFIRVAIRTEPENERIVEALSDVLEGSARSELTV